MEKKKLVGMDIIWIVLLCMAILTVFTMVSSGEWIGIVINLAFLLGMGIMLKRADKKGIRCMERTEKDCTRIAQWLSEMHEAGMDGEILWNYMKNSQLVFQDEAINARWNDYQSGTMREDGENYLNEDEIFQRYEKTYCDMVPGLLTALGILGTFLGLIISMNSFSLNDPDVLETALGNIVGGMNVAFYTSVYGVALSIVFNLVNRNQQKKLSEAYYELVECLHRHFKEKASGDSSQQILEYSKNQQKSLEQIANTLENEMADRIGTQIGQSVEPVFREINKSLNRVIGDFRKEQSASLQSVVQSFVEQMRIALDVHIDELGKSVEELSDSQKQMSEDMRSLLAEIGRTVADTRTVNQESALILQKFERYMEKINEMITVANKTFVSVEHYAMEMYNTSVNQSKIVNDLELHEREITAACRKVCELQESVTRQNMNNIEFVQQVGEKELEFARTQEQLSANLEKYGQGTMDIFAEMKAAQLAAAVQYQNSWKMLESMISMEMQKSERKEKQSEFKGNDTESRLMQMMAVQTNVLCTMQEYLERMEEKRNRKLSVRFKKYLKRGSRNNKKLAEQDGSRNR